MIAISRLRRYHSKTQRDWISVLDQLSDDGASTGQTGLEAKRVQLPSVPGME
jgi:hypothetical protein